MLYIEENIDFKKNKLNFWRRWMFKSILCDKKGDFLV